MSIADGLLEAIEEINILDKKLARDIGEHIDSQARTLQALKNEVEAKAFPLAPLGRSSSKEGAVRKAEGVRA
ncbi:hypothetical protein PMIT1342_00342 [Prochlorococcus marinus str. MIT 1342]|uniref:hypothetical protein n=1 Tax=Prochlorococcus TaxID=1218 RepID=UPI0007BB56A1|nr:hypothetical protein [Prochlorococcus marinus]KZR83550.1 hypothetical protein PMIT1342_00342 [Prochlorococcus marinus str. MIT 1342]